MSDNDRGTAIARRKSRIIGYIKERRTVSEICDLEGIDTANEPKRLRAEIAEPAGLTLTLGGNPNPPAGLMDIDSTYRLNLSAAISDLRSDRHYTDVAQMTGLTNVEQKRAIKKEHNWTIAQLQRLGVATGRTFEQVVELMMRPPITDFRNRK